ncbi:lipoate--protein ligase [Francisella philomiragia]|uniref:Lipoyltransferase and lipoate-ligase family protein n=1 Tax=Francisella philomiragia TaxID=28110 RepID=A0AAW3DD11_9GAMM|nr:lipoate--protein ligase [Francisella philomiragia]KFJ43801.1 lipoyltransferase and lipoate-ligase family protein [Francisella philomiragia]MBK2254421.1 lipoate--protein ligase [Francisella philomiragia]MBK2272786.1 lipoate--protein ligase [Francisella philomiragia]MBK2276575.1 lipoate--protein ligase [Francisella philomiragia]MBK2280696.1 lipoate--protein ligase [Francisella philomiragia]
MHIYISQSNDIYFNLAFENWLFLEKLHHEKILFLWQNSPCVVIGRAQNPWLECNLEAMTNDNIPMVRRQSGGGTVYHDYGNLNYTIISTKKEHDIKANLELVCNTVKKLGIDVYANERNDIVVDHNGHTYKVSGSAFREKKDRAFHHGTLLINANTKKLYDYLHQPIDKSLDTKGVKSHRSKVINLSEIKHDIQTQDLTRSFIKGFRSIDLSLINEETPLENRELIDKEIEILKEWKWRFGKTLPFTKTYTKGSEQIKIKIDAGIVTEINNVYKNTNLADKNIRFENGYDFDFFKKILTE